MSAEISIREAAVEDAGTLLELERSCPEAPHWSEAAWAQVLAQSDPSPSFGTRRYGPLRRCFVAEQAEAIVGFVVFSFAGGNVAEMESIVVREDARRHSVGRSLCLQAIYCSQAMGAQSLQLEVRSANAAALALYRSLGFAEQGRRKDYYNDPADDAVLMAVPLTSNCA